MKLNRNCPCNETLKLILNELREIRIALEQTPTPKPLSGFIWRYPVQPNPTPAAPS